MQCMKMCVGGGDESPQQNPTGPHPTKKPHLADRVGSHDHIEYMSSARCPPKLSQNDKKSTRLRKVPLHPNEILSVIARKVLVS